MSRQFAWVFLAVCVAVTSLGANGQEGQPPAKQETREPRQRSQDQNRWKWWLNPESRKEIGISDVQSRQIDEIFEATMPAQRAKAREWEQLERVVSKLLKDRTADVATVTQHVEKLEKLGAELDITRTVMLYRINLLLSPEQVGKLEAYRKRRDENRRKSEHR